MTTQSAVASSGAVAPTTGRDRIEMLDALRGFALFGVVVVNMSVDTIWSHEFVSRTKSQVDDLIATSLVTLGAGKFLTIFTLLFGLGLFMQIQRCEERGIAPTPLLSRRLLILLALGLAHYLLIGWTDILHVYAVLGFVLLAAHRFSARALLVTAVATMLLNVGEPKPLIIMAGEQIVTAGRDAPPPAGPDLPVSAARPAQEAEDDVTARAIRVFGQGTYGDILRENGRDLIDYLLFFAPRWWFGSLLPIMLLGAYFARRQILEHLDKHLRLLRLIFSWGLVLGLSGSILTLVRDTLWADNDLPFSARQLLAASEYVGIRALGFAYASGFVLAARQGRVDRLLVPLAAVGRTALTNYLLQTVVAVVLFFSGGFGLYGRVSPVLGIVIATITFTAQGLASVWWLSRYRYGPAEWAWRSLTYGRLQPMRL